MALCYLKQILMGDAPDGLARRMDSRAAPDELVMRRMNSQLRRMDSQIGRINSQNAPDELAGSWPNELV